MHDDVSDLRVINDHVLNTSNLEKTDPSETERTYNIRNTIYLGLLSLFMRTNGKCHNDQLSRP